MKHSFLVQVSPEARSSAIFAALSRLLADAVSTLDVHRDSTRQMLTRAVALLESGEMGGGRRRSGLAPWQAQRIMRLIEEDLGRSVAVEEMAKAVRLSRSHFSRAFKMTLASRPSYLARSGEPRRPEDLLGHACLHRRRVVDTGSFSAAARIQNMGQPAVSKLIVQREGWLGVRLLLRSTRGLTSTEAGLNFYPRARRTLEEADEALLAARGAPTSLSGRVKVSAAVCFVRLHIVPHLPEFLKSHPDIEIDFRLEDRIRPQR